MKGTRLLMLPEGLRRAWRSVGGDVGVAACEQKEDVGGGETLQSRSEMTYSLCRITPERAWISGRAPSGTAAWEEGLGKEGAGKGGWRNQLYPRKGHGFLGGLRKMKLMQSLRRELSDGIRPLHETFVALVRSFGSKGLAVKGLEILAAMEKLNYDICQAWLVLVEELVRGEYLQDANNVFLKGSEGGLRAIDSVYDLLIEENCKVGDHSNTLTISYEMEAAGRMETTFHFNCLLSVQANCGIPEIAFSTFENMEFGEGHL